MAATDDRYAQHAAHVARTYDDALRDAGYDRVIVFSGVERMRPFDDTAYPFTATAHFRWWVPLNDPGCAVVHTRGEAPMLFHLQPTDFWHAPPGALAPMIASAFEVHTAHDAGDLTRFVDPARRTAWLGEADQVPEAFADTVDVNPPQLVRPLNFARGTKTAWELERLREASDRAARGHLAARQAFLDGASEYEIHQRYLVATEHTDADLPYPSIVALNEHAATLHYQHRERARSATAARTFLLDAGATAAGYASDITRTWVRDETTPFAALLAAMERLQQAICAEVSAGKDFVQLHLLTHERLAGVLRDAGLVADMTPEATIETGVTSTFFPHGLGHLLGLQVHDVGGFQPKPGGGRIAPPQAHPFLRLTRTLAENQVVTIEPGLYFIPSLLEALRASPQSSHINWPLVDSLVPFGGIRIEDDVVATRGGHENLTRTAFAAIAV